MEMQILEAGHWVTVSTRTRTRAGMERLYKLFCRDNPQNQERGEPWVAGMRIVTVLFEHLGELPRKKSPNEKAEAPATGDFREPKS